MMKIVNFKKVCLAEMEFSVLLLKIVDEKDGRRTSFSHKLGAEGEI
jgi:hypothetical protein